jgi:hypothetical protein
VCGRQLEALWVLSEPSPGMTDLLGHVSLLSEGSALFIGI